MCEWHERRFRQSHLHDQGDDFVAETGARLDDNVNAKIQTFLQISSDRPALEDRRSLSDDNIHKESMLHVMLHLGNEALHEVVHGQETASIVLRIRTCPWRSTPSRRSSCPGSENLHDENWSPVQVRIQSTKNSGRVKLPCDADVSRQRHRTTSCRKRPLQSREVSQRGQAKVDYIVTHAKMQRPQDQMDHWLARRESHLELVRSRRMHSEWKAWIHRSRSGVRKRKGREQLGCSRTTTTRPNNRPHDGTMPRV